METVDIDMIERARVAGEPVVKHTPTVTSQTLSEMVGGAVTLKVESLQRTGAFKVRGAMNKLHDLGDAARRGVTAGSAGNHAQALALAATHHGVPCEIYVPAGAPVSKIAACEGYGATVREVGASVEDAVAAARRRAEEPDGPVLCHPFDDPVVVAGQGTLGLELLVDQPDLACVIVPVGGGGLAAGTAMAVKTHRPDVSVIGVQAAVCAPYAGGVPHADPMATLADGIAVKRPGEVTGPLVERWLDDVVTVDEDTIADAMILLMQRAKLVVEGAGAVGVAALLSGAVRPAASGTTCAVLSGGNVDLGVVPGLIRRHETEAGRRLSVFARVDDRPGGLVRLLDTFACANASVIEVQHVREGLDLHVRESGLRVSLEVRGPEHAQATLAAARAAGFDISVEQHRRSSED